MQSLCAALTHTKGAATPPARSTNAREKKAIVTGAEQGIGAGLVEDFLQAGYNVVAKSLRASWSLSSSPRLILVEGDIGNQESVVKPVPDAIQPFETIHVLVN